MKELTEKKQREKPSTHIVDYARTLWRKKYFVLVPVILAGGIAAVGVRFLTPVYKSSTVIRVQDRDVLSREVAQLVEDRRTGRDWEMLADMRAEMASSPFIDQLIRDLGVLTNPSLVAHAQMMKESRYPDLSVEEIILRRLRGRLRNKFEVDREGPSLFRIACLDYDPETCYRLTDAATHLYINNYQRRYVRDLEEAGQFSDDQIAVYRTRLEQSELELEALKNRIAKRNLENNPVNKNNIQQAETARQQLEIRIDEVNAVVTKLESNLTRIFGRVPKGTEIRQDPTVIDIWNRLVAHRETELRLELGANILAATGANPEGRQRNEAETRRVEGQLQSYLRTLVERLNPDIDADYRPLIVEYFYHIAIRESYKAKHQSLLDDIAEFQAFVQLQPQLERELAKAQGEVESNRSIYNSFLKAKTSAQISEAAHNINLDVIAEVVERAFKPETPEHPKKPKIIVLAIAFGAFLGFAGLFVSEYTDSSFRTVEEIESKLGFRVLGTVPHFTSGSEWNRERNRKQGFIWATTSLIVVVVSLFAFYYYGKQAAKQAISVHVTQSELEGP